MPGLQWSSYLTIFALLVMLPMTAPRVRADLPTPARVGFHHCALLYDRAARTAEDLLPYVAHVENGRPRAWLFDAFLFLHFHAKSGVRTDDGKTTRDDWLHQLDTWFAPGRDLRALDEAIGRAARSLGTPARPRRVLLTIPYPNPTVRAFGTLPDGASPDLGTLDGVRTVVQWYVEEGRRRFREAGFRYLELWGFYWMREEMPLSDEPRVAAAAEVVHGAGLRLAWIPWWRAAGFDRWRTAGFDVAFLQPNYAFHSWTHGGSVRRNRLAAAADLARTHGMGLEMEAGGVLESEPDRIAFLHYLAEGRRARLNYQRSAMAYFLGVDTVERASRSKDRTAREVYTALADFVRGRDVRDPSPVLKLRRTRDEWIGSLPDTRTAANVDLLFAEELGKEWRGLVEVQVKSDAAGPWRPGGWALRSGKDKAAGRRQVVTLPIGAPIRQVKVRISGEEAFPAREMELAVEERHEASPRHHTALGCAYAMHPHEPGLYDDDGTRLTDGVEPAGGFGEGRSVGWTAPLVAVLFDLGTLRTVDRVEVACQGGSYAGINWPTEATLLLSKSRPPVSLSGVGPPPEEMRWVPGEAPEVVRRRSASDLDGVLRFHVRQAQSARYLAIVFRPSGWLMLSEVRIFESGRNIAAEPGVRYALQPRPTPSAGISGRYADDGFKLTDGEIAAAFNPNLLVGWAEEAERTVEIDLGRPVTVSSVTVWSLAGGLYGVYAPQQVTVKGAEAGGEYRHLGHATSEVSQEDGTQCTAAAYRVTLEVPARVERLLVTVRRNRGWAMISEIEVEAARNLAGGAP